MTHYYWYSGLNQTMSEVSRNFVGIVTKNNPELLDQLNRGERIDFQYGSLMIVVNSDEVLIIDKKDPTIYENAHSLWELERLEDEKKRKLQEDHFRLQEEELKRRWRSEDEDRKERQRMESDEIARRNMIWKSLEEEKRKISKEKRDKKKQEIENMSEEDKIKLLQEKERKRLREEQEKERKRLREEERKERFKFLDIEPLGRKIGICKMLHHHVDVLKDDPERLSTDFLKELMGTKKCKDVPK